MLAVRRNDDGHLPRETLEIASTGIGDYGDSQLRRVPIHDTHVLKNECTRTTVKSATDLLDCYVGSGALDGGASGQHLSRGSGFEITEVGFVENHPAKEWVVGVIVLRSDLDVKGSGSAGHTNLCLMEWSGSCDGHYERGVHFGLAAGIGQSPGIPKPPSMP